MKHNNFFHFPNFLLDPKRLSFDCLEVLILQNNLTPKRVGITQTEDLKPLETWPSKWMRERGVSKKKSRKSSYHKYKLKDQVTWSIGWKWTYLVCINLHGDIS